MNDYIFTIVNTKAPQKSSQEVKSLSSVVGIIKGEEESSASIFLSEKQTDWRRSAVIPEKYSSYRDEYIDMLTTIQP